MNKKFAELAALFLKLGIIGFGGPAAHIALMRREVVARKKWMDDQHFLDLVGATNLIPGPNSTEMAIHLGRERAGLRGLILSGACFILPAVLITGVLAWLYERYGRLPELRPFIAGIQPAVLAVMIGAVIPLIRTAIKSWILGTVGLLAFALCFWGVNELFIMLGAGIPMVIKQRVDSTPMTKMLIPVLLFSQPTGMHLKLFLTFLKIGSVLYGSGYVLFALLENELVPMGLITHKDLMEAISAGQITPGPVFSAVTFIGYIIDGVPGAAASTLGVFLPSFIFVWLLNPLVPKMRSSAPFSAFLDAVNAVSVVLILYACYKMGSEAIHDWRLFIIAAACLIVTLLFRNVNSVIIIVAGGIAGYALF